MISRTLTVKLQSAADQYPVISLTGPRQSRKTTLVRAAFPNHEYVSLEDPELRAFPAALVYAGDSPYRRNQATVCSWSDL